jgi:hypothetical protein
MTEESPMTNKEEYILIVQRLTQYVYNVHRATNIPIKVLIRKYLYEDINNLIKNNTEQLEKSNDRDRSCIQKNSEDSNCL